MCSGDGDVPLYLRVADGNESDQAIFAQLMREFREQWDCEALFVADAALYSEANLQSLSKLRWLSRVPATIKETQQLMEQVREEAFVPSQLAGYRYACVCSTYAGSKQRWLLVESEARKESDRLQLEEKIQQHLDSAQQQLQQLGQQEFACVPDAEAAAAKWSKKLRYHRLDQIEVVPHPYYKKAGRPRKGQVPDGYHYRLQGTLSLKEETLTLASTRAGRFVLATNVLESKSLSDEQMLCEGKPRVG